MKAGVFSILCQPELQVAWPHAADIFFWADLFFALLFTVELLGGGGVLGHQTEHLTHMFPEVGVPQHG